MTERARVALLAERFGPAGGAVRLGIGDDAAVLAPGEGSLVWTIDAQVEGTHFRRAWLAWEDVGWRSFMAAASDLAAMGATPVAALSALVLTPDIDDAALAAIAEGQRGAAAAVGAPVVGGNLARGTETSVTTTLLGRAERPIERRGARAGDGIFVAGPLGLAAAGLAVLERGESVQSASVAVAAWRRPAARIADGLALGSASAAIDVSDGLSADARQVAEASEVVLVFDEAALRAHGGADLAAAARLLGRDPLDLVLEGGEDYALLATSAEVLPGFVRIGTVEAGAPAVVVARADGTRAAVAARGFDHFG